MSNFAMGKIVMNKYMINLRERAELLKQKHKWKESIPLLQKIIDEENVPMWQEQAYYDRGMAHWHLGDNKKAIEDWEQAMKLTPSNGYLRFIIGDMYYSMKEYDKALLNFVEAGNIEKTMKFNYPPIYIACKINDLCSMSEGESVGKTLKMYLELSKEIYGIQHRLFHLTEKHEVAHYTSLHALKILINKGRFRFYNAAYMNDPDEGRVFFEIMKKRGLDDVEKFFYDENIVSPHYSPAYIGSFIGIESGTQKEELPLWRTYGKHDADEAAGACLIFKRSCFSELFEPQTEGMQRLYMNDLLSRHEQDQIPEAMVKSKMRPINFKITYVDFNNQQHYGMAPEISHNLHKLLDNLADLKNHIANIDDKTKQPALKTLACELLDSIRFLFKANYYRQENEVRVIKLRYADSVNQETDRIEVDMDSTPPRFYVEAAENFQFGEVILGPRAKHFRDWEMWINRENENIKVNKSDINYGR